MHIAIVALMEMRTQYGGGTDDVFVKSITKETVTRRTLVEFFVYRCCTVLETRLFSWKIITKMEFI